MEFEEKFGQSTRNFGVITLLIEKLHRIFHLLGKYFVAALIVVILITIILVTENSNGM